MREVRADRLYRIVGFQRTRAARDLRPAPGAFTELAVTGGAFPHVDRFAVFHRAFARWQAFPVRPHVNIPAGDLGGCYWLADGERALGGECRARKRDEHRERAKTLRHSRP